MVTAWGIPMHLPFLPRKLQARLLLTYVVLTGVGLGGLIVWMGLRLQTAVLERAAHDLHVQTLVLVTMLAEPFEHWQASPNVDRSALDALVRSYADSVGARVTVLDPAFRVLVSSDETVPTRVAQAHPEMAAARLDSTRQDIRWDEWRQEVRLFVAAPLRQEDGQFEGVVQLSMPMAPLRREIRQTWMGFAHRWRSDPGRDQPGQPGARCAGDRADPAPHRGDRRHGCGRLEQRVRPAGPDEIARLGRTFNRMAEYV